MDSEGTPYTAPLTDVVERARPLRRADILCLDIVGFARLPESSRAAAQRELSQLVYNIPEVATQQDDADDLIVRSSHDGISLLFFKDMLSPLRAAMQIQSLLQSDAARIAALVGAPFKVRMGIHAGEVTIDEDANGRRDADGDGLDIAQQVKDLGDADHILLSDSVARVLLNKDPWSRYITHLGEVRFKRNVRVDVYNLYGRLDGPYCGNPGTPKKVADELRARNREARAARPKLSDAILPYRRTIVTFLMMGLIAYGVNWHYKSNPQPYQKMWKTIVTKVIPKLPDQAKGVIPKKYGGTKPEPKRPKPPPPPPVKKVVVPNLVGVDSFVAAGRAQDVNLRTRVVLGQLTRYAENIVYKQSPPAGRKVVPNTEIVITVSAGLKTGAAPAPKPNPAEDPGDSPGSSGDPGGD